MEVWKTIFLSKWVIFRFHVNLPGCRLKLSWYLTSANIGFMMLLYSTPDRRMNKNMQTERELLAFLIGIISFS